MQTELTENKLWSIIWHFESGYKGASLAFLAIAKFLFSYPAECRQTDRQSGAAEGSEKRRHHRRRMMEGPKRRSADGGGIRGGAP